MKTFKTFGWGAAIILLITPGMAGAAKFIRSENGAVATQEESAEDIFIAGNGVTVDKAVEDDIFAAGNVVDIRTIGGADVYAAGNTVRISGKFGDDITAVGNSVVISAQADDVMAAGATVEITSHSELDGQAYLAGGVVVISGRIGGTARIAADHVEIKSGAVIDGDVIVYSENEPVVEEGAAISGERRLVAPKQKTAAGSQVFDVFNWVRSVIAMFIVAWLMLYLLPGLTSEQVGYAMASGGKAFGLGIIWMLLLIPACILLLATLIGIPVALALLGKTLVLAVAAGGLAALLGGRWLLKLITKQESELTWQHALVGAVGINLVAAVPILGGLIVMVIWLIGFGAIEIVLWRRLKEIGAKQEG